MRKQSCIYWQAEVLYQPIQEGLYTHLKEFDFVKVFQTADKDNDVRYCVYFHPDREECPRITRTEFEKAHREHWHTDGQAHPLEVFHRTSKQVCNIEHFFVRSSSSIKTRLFAALRAFIRLTALVKDQLPDSFYALHRQLFLQAHRELVLNFASVMDKIEGTWQMVNGPGQQNRL